MDRGRLARGRVIFASGEALTNGAFATAGGAAFVALLQFFSGRTTRGDQVLDKAIARLEKDVARLEKENRTMHDEKIPALELELTQCRDREALLNARVLRLEERSHG